MLRSMKQIKDFTVIDNKNEVVGQVYDFYFDDFNWTTRYMVVDLGTWLPGRKVLLSPAALEKPDWGGGVSFPVNLSQEQIENSPSIETAQPVSRQSEEELAEYYNWPTYWNDVTFHEANAVGMSPETYLEGLREASEAQAAAEAERQQVGAKSTPKLRSIDEVLGYYIEATDDSIGHVEDFIVDTDSWEIRYLVIDTQNWWPGKKVTISPLWVNNIDWPENRVHVDLTRDTIKSAPEYDPKAPINREYEEQLFNYYGQPIYW